MRTFFFFHVCALCYSSLYIILYISCLFKGILHLLTTGLCICFAQEVSIPWSIYFPWRFYGNYCVNVFCIILMVELNITLNITLMVTNLCI